MVGFHAEGKERGSRNGRGSDLVGVDVLPGRLRADYHRGLAVQLFALVPLGAQQQQGFKQLMTVDEYQAGHHANDLGPSPAWGGVGDDIYGPCAIAGMFGCSPTNSTNDYFRDGDPHVSVFAFLSED